VAGEAGQFVMLSLPQQQTQGFAFRRAFSWHTVADTKATILYKPFGWGTQALTQAQAGQTLSVLGALGRPFPTFAQPANTLVIAGGVGLPPLLRWASNPAHKGASLLYGVRDASQVTPLLPDINAVFAPDACHLMADDGSLPSHLGQAGSVITWLGAKQEQVLAKPPAQVLVCGPNRMMAAVVQWWQTYAPAVPVWVSLENHMPCGTGACWGCVVAQADTAEGQPQPPVRVCDEGPVLPAHALRWVASGPAASGW